MKNSEATTWKWLDSTGLHTVTTSGLFNAIEMGMTFVKNSIFPAQNNQITMNTWIAYQN